MIALGLGRYTYAVTIRTLSIQNCRKVDSVHFYAACLNNITL